MGVFRVRIALAFAAGGRSGSNSWCVRTIGGSDTADVAAAVNGAIKPFYTTVAGSVPSASTFKWDGTATELGTTTPSLLTPSSPWTVTGTVPGSNYTAAAGMACVTWRTSLATRRGRGRTFIGPLASGVVEADGSLGAANLTQFNTAISALVAYNNNDLSIGSVAVWSTADGVARDIVGGTITDQVAILRSRRD